VPGRPGSHARWPRAPGSFGDDMGGQISRTSASRSGRDLWASGAIRAFLPERPSTSACPAWNTRPEFRKPQVRELAL